MFTWVFWKAVLERSLSTFAEVFVSFYTVDAMAGWTQIDVVHVATVSGIAAGLAVLKSLVAYSQSGTASLGRHEAIQSKVVDER
jgi:hypothetical protein